MSVDSQVPIWERVIEFDPSTLSLEAARAIIALNFRPSAHERMKELATKNQDGIISFVEKRELESYVHLGDLLTLLQAEARLALHKAGIGV